MFGSSFSTFSCPVCRVVTKPPRPYTAKETWADQFPINHWILSVIEESEFIEIPDVPICELHKGCKINLYCSDHKKPCCATCVAISHRQCDHVDEIEKLVTDWDKDVATNDLLVKTKQIEDLFIDLDAKCVLAESNLHITKDRLSSSIETEFDKVFSHLNELKENAFKELETKYQPITEEIESRKKQCERGKHMCQEARSIIDKVCTNKSMPHSFIDFNCARNKLDSLNECQVNTWTLPEVNEMTFTPNTELHTVSRIKILGKVENKRDKKVVALSSAKSNEKADDHAEIVSNEHDIFENIQKRTTQARNYCHVINILPIDRWSQLNTINCWNNTLLQSNWISGSQFLNHGVLMACNQTRASLCLVRESAFLYEEKRNSPPWCVTKVGDSSAAVTYPQENCVRIFDMKYSGPLLKIFRRPSILGRPVVLQRTFGTDDPCFGVTASSDRIFLASEDSIKVFTIGGRCCQLLKLSLRSEPLFKRVVGLAFDSRYSILYAADETNNTVLAFKVIEKQLMHQPVFLYSDEKLRCPQNVEVGIQSEILVTGFVSKTIHMLDRFGSCTRILSLDRRPSCISLDHKHRLLLIGYYPERGTELDFRSNQIIVYKLNS